MNRPRRRDLAERRERERGSITAMVVVFAAAFLVLGGLVYDAGRAMAAKTTAIDEAQQAARTAAQALNAGELRNNVLATTPGQASPTPRHTSPPAATPEPSPSPARPSPST